MDNTMSWRDGQEGPRLPHATGYKANQGVPGMYGAIDLGTNNCRLMIAAPHEGGFRVVDSFNRVVRLGEGLQSTGQLSGDAMDRTIEALRICAARMGRRRLRRYRAVATEACRRAGNGAAFIARARRETGLDITVISPREEAELVMESCGALLHDDRLSPARTRAMLFDIGGGSTEIAWVRTDHRSRRQDLNGYLSLPAGVITLAEQFGDAAFSEDGYQRMVDLVTRQLHAFERVHCIGREISRGNVSLMGTSGTVTTLASIALSLTRYSRTAVDGTILQSGPALGAIRTLAAMGPMGLRQHPCVGPDRAAYVLPGCAIFEAIHKIWPVSDIVVADRGLRDGMLLRMMHDSTAMALPSLPSSLPFAPSSLSSVGVSHP
ncbi:Ppx/GppA phosphatase [Gluconacetobacter diazotrophicus PA1 5]|uniref:Exopolyphosphatase protein n=2 Tax=Gluconacetobacter diazotrophicus TaxID=33996 RepID=A9HIS8_GLUDA|nr:Ppx/GppA phosphatase family protein [Gluconacetobacter diazotrophicus]ACI49893.1 Ppx/GppA phosphatase [Gluconacetobacter diazotrophicus PA1 5]MBB2156444.1 Ppx/GppA family phosphatase [Gluconacetobacter diazotrophicus]TWB05937.1 exopolyphosphatase/guanosine-5'-triphosphate,3'-diphosphate pyrophosphatase [Gluconacetobacter diazotrophicus]CAP55809.1 Exopolyphosphatase protein [Gluconacetobacter diazotrophicus PA1 5]